ncbi:class I SAM-dependent methyltransferase [Candidatus Pelagibacter sp.]|jgi:predicted O-methyltransferase YrrM|nr:class I SAM-dependent methyltransferase [Candidatus Pelagibacter sp.]
MESKLDYIIEKIKNIQKIQILELGVQSGASTKKFIELCNANNGFLTSIDIDDCSNVIKSKRWKFIHSSDDNFEIIDKIIPKTFDFIFIDSLHEPNHVEKVFYHYYSFLKKGGICIIDDISWLPYSKNQYRDNEFAEHINRATFNKILEIYDQNKLNFSLEFFLQESGYAIITKNNENFLNKSIKIHSREYGLKNLLRKLYRRKPKH